MLKLRVLESLAASRDGELIEGLQSKSLFALLWAKGSDGLTRESAALLLWPNESFSQSSGKLRVALTRLRRQLPSSALQESQSRLRLNFAELEVDFDQAIKVLEAFLDEISDQRQVADSAKILQLLSLDLLPDFDAAWLTAIRLTWNEIRTDAAKALISASVSQGRTDLALQAAKAGLAWDSANEEFLERVILSAIEFDQKGEAKRVFLEGEAKLKEVDPQASLPKHLADLAFDRAESGAQPLDKNQRESVLRFFEKLNSQSPELALEVMAMPAFREEVLRQPGPTLRLLESCLSRSSLQSEASHRCLARASSAAGLIHDSKKSIEYGEKALSLATPLSLKKAVRLNCSFTYFWMGQIEKAHEMIDQAIADCHELGDEIDALLARSQKASFWWHEDRLDDAEETYDLVLEKLKAFSKDSLVDIVTVAMNRTALAAHKRDWGAARRHLDQTLAYYRQYRPLHILPQLKPLQGIILAQTGDFPRGAELLARGIGSAYRSQQSRTLAVALLYAAELFAECEVKLDPLIPGIRRLLNESGGLQSKAINGKIVRLEEVLGSPQESLDLESLCRKVVQKLRALAGR